MTDSLVQFGNLMFARSLKSTNITDVPDHVARLYGNKMSSILGGNNLVTGQLLSMHCPEVKRSKSHGYQMCYRRYYYFH